MEQLLELLRSVSLDGGLVNVAVFLVGGLVMWVVDNKFNKKKALKVAYIVAKQIYDEESDTNFITL